MHQTTKHYKVAHVPNEYVAKTLENIMYQRKIKNGFVARTHDLKKWSKKPYHHVQLFICICVKTSGAKQIHEIIYLFLFT
jgi:hypothetical protein